MDDSYRTEIAKLEALYASNPGGRVFVHLAEALRRAGEEERARGILEEGLARHPDSASGFVVLGRVLTNLGERAGAESAFGRVLQLDSGNLVALRGLGDLALEAGRPEEAARHYRELASRSPSNEEVQTLLAQIEADIAAGTGPAGSAEAEPISVLEDQAAETAVAEPSETEGSDVVFAPDSADETSAAMDGAEISEAAATASPDHEEHALHVASAAPGDAGETAAPESEFGIVDIDSLPGDLATFAGLADEDVPEEAADMPAPQELEDLTWHEAEQPEVVALWDEAPEGPPPAVEDGASIDLSDLPPALDVEDTADAYAEATTTGWDGMPDIPADAELPDLDTEAAEGSEPGWSASEPMVEADTEEPAPAPADESATADEWEAAPADEWEAAPADEWEAAPADEWAIAPAGEPVAAPADESVAVPAGEPAMGGDQLETETMADLYRSQGLLDRAAGVYRALLRRRPGDSSLAAKLDATEAELAASAAVEEDAGDGWLRGTGTAWAEAGESGPQGESESPYAWTEAGEEAATDTATPSGPTIAEYLQHLISWQRPDSSSAHSVAAAPGTPAPDTDSAAAMSSDQASDQAPSDQAPSDQAPSDQAPLDARLLDSPDFMAEEPWLQGTHGAHEQADEAAEAAPEAETPQPPSDPWATPDPWADTPIGAAETVQDPWAAPASVPVESSPLSGQPADPVENAFDDWFDKPGEASADATAGAEPSGSEPVGAEPGGDRPAGAEGGAGASSRDEGGEEDEDLAMFRSWLQSLKK